MKKKTTKKKVAKAQPEAKNQPVTIDAETIDFMLEKCIWDTALSSVALECPVCHIFRRPLVDPCRRSG